MEEYKIKGGPLVCITGQQLQIRGGVSLREVFRLARYLKFVFDFIEEYKDDMERGFDKGWRGI